MKNTIGWLILITVILCTSCRKTFLVVVPAFPAETHTGQNTFGCYINGRLWLPLAFFPGERKLTATLNNGQLQVNAYHANQHLVLNLSSVTDTGRYDLAANGNSASFTDSLEHTATSGVVDLKFIDPVNRIASGTFSFVANGISVTQGRFDAILNP